MAQSGEMRPPELERPRRGMARRTHLKASDHRLLARIQRGRWSADELQWVLAHLDPRTPTLVIEVIYAKLIALGGDLPATAPEAER